MKSTSTLTLILMLLVMSPAGAVTDPDPNLIGLYFDRYADGDCAFALEPVPVVLYCILTNPTAAAIDAYEFVLSIEFRPEMDGTFYLLESLVANGQALGIDVGDKSLPRQPEYIVGLATPIPSGIATILHSWQFLVGGSFVTDFYIGPAVTPSLPGGLPVVQEAGGSLMTVWPRVPQELPQAMINECPPFPVEPTTFGTLKALYR